MEIDLELERVTAEINEKGYKLVVLQLPEGLKPKALEIADRIELNTEATPIIWSGSCYGACDVPDLSDVGVDLLIQWGHSQWE